MFAYCNNCPVIYVDSCGKAGILTAFIIASIVAGIANALATASNGGNVEECLVTGLIGAASAAIGFAIAYATGFTLEGAVLARVVSSMICDIGSTWYINGELTSQDWGQIAVDVVLDVCLSVVTYYYTEPIANFVTQTLLNSTIDGGVDILEATLFGAQIEAAPLDMDSLGGGSDCSHSVGISGGVGNRYVALAY